LNDFKGTTMTQAAEITLEPASCGYGSGLRPDRCCALDWAEPPAPQQPVPEFDRALAAARSGNTPEAERLVIAVLERFPRHVGALDLLYQIRLAQNRMTAAEALLERIVRLDPNNLKATQTLASLLFGRGALADAEHHARNAVRLSPADPQSHNLMGMIMTEANRPQIGEYHYRRVLDLTGSATAFCWPISPGI
jgi:predicted Zn-dependent protease